MCEKMSVLKTARAFVGSCGCSWHQCSNTEAEAFEKPACPPHITLELPLIKVKLQLTIYVLQIKRQKEWRRQAYLCPAYSNWASLDTVL